MKFHEAIAAGIKHIQENKSRAELSILGIFIGIASVPCMMAIGDGAKQIIADDIEKIGGTTKFVSGHAPSFTKKDEPLGEPLSVTPLRTLLLSKRHVLEFYLHCRKMIGSKATHQSQWWARVPVSERRDSSLCPRYELGGATGSLFH